MALDRTDPPVLQLVDPVTSAFNDPTGRGSATFPPSVQVRAVPAELGVTRDRVLKLRFIKRPSDQRIVKCEVFDADTREVVGQIFVSDVTLKYEANGSHPEALVRLISAWEDAYG